jgi:hypothetical protein
MPKFLMLCLLWILCTPLQAQKKAEKWGKIPKEDLEMTVYSQDSTAAAVVLQDVGKQEIEYLNSRFSVTYTHYRRIKVLDIAGFKEGNLMIPYRSVRNAELFIDLDVQITMPDGQTQKVRSDNVFTEKLTKNLWAKKVFVPNLLKGAVIEYRYTLQSNDLVTLYDWYFQDELPVRWSELELSIPTRFEYVYLMHTDKPFDLKTSEINVLLYGNARLPTAIVRSGMANLPAMKDEPFVTTTEDYRAHIGFQLKSVMREGASESEAVLSTWEKVAERLMESSQFGSQITKKNKSDQLWALYSAVLQPGDDLRTKAAKALQTVQANLKWNGRYRVFTTAALDDVADKKTGSSADLNLALVALLRRAEVPAWPLLCSTRFNGRIFQEYPFVEQFNSVLALVRIGDESLLLDATNPFLAPNQLNREHYNSNGWVVDTRKVEWIPLKAPETAETWYGNVRLSEAGALSGRFVLSASGNTAVQWRSKLADAQDYPAFVKTIFATGFPEARFDSIRIEHASETAQPLQLSFNCQVPGVATAVNDFLYLQPVLDFSFLDNPFTSLSRTYPVNFPYPLKGTYVMDIQLPKNYQMVELPAPARIQLHNNGGKLQFSCSQMAADKIQLVLKMQLSRVDFEPYEYDGLRQFFILIADKTRLQLALKKN